MGNTAKQSPSLNRGPIAAKLLAKMNRKRILEDPLISAPGTGHETEEALQATVASISDFAGMHPSHAAYVYTQNHVCALAEHLTGYKEMAPFAAIISKAEHLYMPGGAPLSPLTTSYFTCWSFFDACVGAANETIGGTLLEFCAAFDIGNELSRLIRLMLESRMGLYINKGREGHLLVIEELVTGTICKAIVPASDFGEKGELWYVRVLPPPFPGESAHVVFTTPYIVMQPGLREWLAYFNRILSPQSRTADYGHHMKYGPTRAYWNDFVFEAYVNHKVGGIYLAGLPDIPSSRPHSEVNRSSDVNTRKQ